MQAAKETISNMASAAKEHITIWKAKVEEKADKAAARTPEEKEMAKERRKAKEAQAKMEFHQAKARHAAEKVSAKQSHLPGRHRHGHRHPTAAGTQYTTTEPVVGAPARQPVGTAATVAGTNAPTYPLGGHPPGPKYV